MSLENMDVESLKIILSSESTMDSVSFVGPFESREEGYLFFKNYGFNLNDPIENAELFGIFQEAIQFIKRYFLKAGYEEGLDLTVPSIFYTLTDVSDLSLIESRTYSDSVTDEEVHWASIILKVMHTILHTDKDLRYHYFSTIQTQILDRFYKFLHRNEDNGLYLKSEKNETTVELIEFETKGGFNTKNVSSEFIDIYLSKINELGPQLFLKLLQEMNDHDIINHLNSLKVPTLIIGGDQDKVIPNYNQRVMHQEISNSELFIVKNGSHVPQLDFPEFINKRVKIFLEDPSYQAKA